MHPVMLAKIFNPMHRLSLEEVVPENYDVALDLQEKGFSGVVKITVRVLRNTNVIRLNSKGLEISSSSVQKEEKTIPLTATLQEENDLLSLSSSETLSGSLDLVISFSGSYATNLEGLYRSGNIIATHMEPASARRVIPCFDQPDMKATFTVTVTVPEESAASENYTVLSNMPLAPSKKDHRTYQFEKTPKMSTYLFAIVAGPLAYVSGTTSRGTKVSVYAETGSESLGYFSLYTAIRCLEFFEHYFAAHYPLPKLDLVALPAFAMGAMENWGLVTFRASALLYDPETTPVLSQRNIAITVCHELAHMWFGNLVTMQWWSDLWLNEGFATWASMLAVRELGLFEISEKIVKASDSSRGYFSTAGETGEGDSAAAAAAGVLGSWNPFLVYETESGMGRDALRSTHPIAADVRDPVEVEHIFDEISYAKGAALIRMVEDWVGPEVFRDGLRRYIGAYHHSNTTTAMLWEAIDRKGPDSNVAEKVTLGHAENAAAGSSPNPSKTAALSSRGNESDGEEEEYSREKRVCLDALTASVHQKPDVDGCFSPDATRQRVSNKANSDNGKANYGESLADVVQPWVTREGFPYIKVTTTEKNTVVLSQDRFALGFVPEKKAEPWSIPLAIRWEDGSTTRLLFSESEMEIERKTDLFWLNPGYTGFYRVLYAEPHYTRLLEKTFRAVYSTGSDTASDQALRIAKEKDENAADRLKLLADRRAFSAGGYGVKRSLSEFAFLAEEENDDVLSVGLGDLRELAVLFYDDKAKKETFQRAMRLLVSKRALKVVSRAQAAKAHEEGRSGDQEELDHKPPMSVRRKEALLVQQGLSAEDEELKGCLREFSANIKFLGDLRTSPELQKAAYMAVANERFEDLVAIYKDKTRSPGQRTDALLALGSSTGAELGDQLFERLEEIVEKQDVPRIFSALAANDDLKERAASFMIEKFERIRKFVDNSGLMRWTVELALESVGSSMDAEISAFLAEHVATDAELKPAALKVRDKRLLNAQMRKNVMEWDLGLEALEALGSE